ncbi:uncharacterized protein TRAVEDRAFT_31673, partial [Trametes versicolor FP-101664 SS1]|uniref:uncharacterized protein n=1 Tax=Trametes versicolor (strain FP-101664) TaxID=717944 RepID=UPI0004622795
MYDILRATHPRRADASNARPRRLLGQAHIHAAHLAPHRRPRGPPNCDTALPCTRAHARAASRRDPARSKSRCFGRFHGRNPSGGGISRVPRRSRSLAPR